MFQAWRHKPSGSVNFVVWEDCPEALGRHILLTSILLDDHLPVRDRIELFLEIHGNVFIKERTAIYVGKLSSPFFVRPVHKHHTRSSRFRILSQCTTPMSFYISIFLSLSHRYPRRLDERVRLLEDLVLRANEAGVSSKKPLALPPSIQLLERLYDLSQLKFQDRDLVAEYYRGCRRANMFDMRKAWDTRLRKWYAERYDVIKNMVDWDYHMRLQPLGMGIPGLEDDLGTIIHFFHFRAWRISGLSYELRDAVYSEGNRTLLSTATGRTQEYKDRAGQDKGRSVSARGFWADILNSPFHAFGVRTEARGFYKITNKQFTRSSVDVAEYNVGALLHELRYGARYAAPEEGALPVAPKAAGPTTADDLADANAGAPSTPSDEATTTAAIAGAQEDAKRREVEARVQAAREAEDRLDAAARDRLLGRFKITLLTGDVDKCLFGRKQFKEAFDVVSIGRSALHLLQAERKLPSLCKGPGALLAIETVRHMVEAKKEQVPVFEEKIADLVAESGWRPVKDVHERWDGITKAHVLFQL